MAVYLDSQEAADRISYSVHTLQFWRSHGGGPPFIRVHGRTVRYRQRDLDQWMNQHGLSRSNKHEPEEIVDEVIPRLRIVDEYEATG